MQTVEATVFGYCLVDQYLSTEWMDCTTVVCHRAEGDQSQSLNEDRKRERIHRKTSSSYIGSKNIDDALVAAGVIPCE